MNLRDFQERCRALRFLDRDDLLAAGLSEHRVKLLWPGFATRAVAAFCSPNVEDAEAQAIWDFIEARLPPGELAGPPA